MTDMAYETDLDVVAEVALELSERIRDEDPNDVFRAALNMIQQCPVKAAQVLLTLAVWFQPNNIRSEWFWEQVEDVTRPRQGTPHCYPEAPPITYPKVGHIRGFDEKYTELKGLGLSDWEASKRLGMSPSAFAQAMYRGGFQMDAVMQELVTEDRRASRKVPA